jgi:hypothetical protein
MNTSEFKDYIKSQMDALSLCKNIRESVCLLKRMEFTIKNYREQLSEQLSQECVVSLLEFHNTMINPTPSKNGYKVKQRDLIVKFKDWYAEIYVTKQPPNGKEVLKYFEDKYGKYPNNGWSQFSFKSEIIDGFSP